jgi:hypothetical protein
MAKAISATFNRRGTELSRNPMIFNAEFSENAQKQLQWSAFVAKNGLVGAPTAIKEVTQQIQLFLGPIIHAVIGGESVREHWSPAGGWHLAS